MEAPASTSFYADSKVASSAGVVQRTIGDELACSFVCKGEFKNDYRSVDPHYAKCSLKFKIM
jgi:hypothetical protein